MASLVDASGHNSKHVGGWSAVHLVEAMGRLSNPIVSGVSPDPKGLSETTEVKKKAIRTRKRPILKSVKRLFDHPGQLSNPYTTASRSIVDLLEIMKDAKSRDKKPKLWKTALRHLSKTDVDYIVAKYQTGSSVNELVRDMRIDRTTILHQLEKRGIPRRGNKRKLNDEIARDAKIRHNLGTSYYELAKRYQVSADTIKREIERAT
jgi:Mor family transcriptional regulator